MTCDKYDKELLWTVPDPLNVSRWERHSTYKIIQKYDSYFQGDVADLGCNNAIACCMLSCIPAVNTVTGFDISKKALDEGAHVIKNHDKCQPDKISLVYSNLIDINSAGNQFDSILCLHTLEHIYEEDLDRVLSETIRVLKDGGYFVFSVPCETAFDRTPAHVSFFSINDGFINLSCLLSSYGFDVIEIYEDVTLGHGNPCITGIAQKINKPKGEK